MKHLLEALDRTERTTYRPPAPCKPLPSDACVRAVERSAGRPTSFPDRGPVIKSARSQNRAAAHAYDLAQWHQYQLAMARNDAERDAIDAEYSERLQAGPDFVSYRARSDFSPPHRHNLTKQGQLEILKAFDVVRSWLWRNRKPRAQGISRTYREILRFLLSMAVKWGTVFPSLATIAKACCCSPRTVDHALAWLRLWGFLDWQRRLKRLPTRLGVVVRQTSNAYRIGLQGLAAIGAVILGRGSDRNNTAPSPSKVPNRAQGVLFRLTEAASG
jgi:hypothetical protein